MRAKWPNGFSLTRSSCSAPTPMGSHTRTAMWTFSWSCRRAMRSIRRVASIGSLIRHFRWILSFAPRRSSPGVSRRGIGSCARSPARARFFMTSFTREWVRKAESDYRVALKLAKGSEPFHDEICFHCQQSVEKYLKALLQELGVVVPRTHVLRDLVDSLLPHHAEVRSVRRGAAFLTRFAVQTRYPGESASKRQTEAALRWAKMVRAMVREILGVGV